MCGKGDSCTLQLLTNNSANLQLVGTDLYYYRCQVISAASVDQCGWNATARMREIKPRQIDHKQLYAAAAAKDAAQQSPSHLSPHCH